MTRWPFAMRATLDRLEKATAGEVATLKRMLDLEHTRNAEAMEWNRGLVQTIVEMRRERDGSFAKPPSMPEPVESDPIDDAISERAGSNPALRRHLLNQKAALLAKGMERDEVRRRLTEWRDPDTSEGDE